jgi:hypothetical protein
MSKYALRMGAVALTSATLLGIGATAAFGASTAGTPPSLSTVQSNAATAITLRVNDLNAAISKVRSASKLGSAAATLENDLQSDVAPLQQLGQQIAADTTVAAARTAAATIFTNFRVLALVLPAARVAAYCTGMLNGPVASLTADATKAATYVTPANQATLTPLIADLNSQLSAATGELTAVPATVLAFTPAQWNANHAVLSSARQSAQRAAGALTAARSDLAKIRADLHPAT